MTVLTGCRAKELGSIWIFPNKTQLRNIRIAIFYLNRPSSPRPRAQPPLATVQQFDVNIVLVGAKVLSKFIGST